jgi:DNA-binding protein H-NS
MTAIERKIEKVRLQQLKLEQKLKELEAEKKLKVLDVDHPEIADLFQIIEDTSQKLKTNPKKILSLLQAKAKGIAPVPRKYKPAVVKYRDTAPGNENNTWSGRGLMPLWLKRYEAAGRNRSEFLVK